MKNEILMEKLIRTHLPYMKHVARSYTENAVLAEDLLQDTILKIWRNKDRFTPGTNFKAWSSIIMRNLFINACRKQKSRNKYLHYAPPTPDKLQVLNTGPQQIAYDDLLKKVNEMKESHSLPIKLLSQGFSYQEIAEEIGTTVGTIKSRIHTARGLLKQRLQVA